MGMKEVQWYGEYYKGSLSEKDCKALIKLRDEVDVIDGLKNCIQNLPSFVITDIINDCDAYLKKNATLNGFTNTYKTEIGTLRDEQTKAVAFMYIAKNVLLGDEVGLGKTVQCAGLINLLQTEAEKEGKPFRYCFLTEKSSVDEIRTKLIKFTGKYARLIEKGDQRVVQKYIKECNAGSKLSVVGTHSLLENSEFLIHTIKNPFDLIIIDESSVLKNTSTNIYKCAEQILKVHDRRILLNATPFEQGIEEMYNQLHLVDPMLLPNRQEFRKTYCVMEQGVFGYNQIKDYKNKDILKKAIGLRYFARTRKELGAKYEGNTYHNILVPLSKEQKFLMQKTSLYNMLYDYPKGVDRNIPFTLETTPKARVLLNIMKTLDLSLGKVLVYCRFLDCQADLQKVLEEQGFKVAVLNGQTKAKEKKQILSEFATNMYDILLTNVKKSLDLNNCAYCINYTIDTNPQQMVQVEGRIIREFDVMYKTVFLLVAEGREKKYIEEKLKMRVDASEALTNQGESMTVQALQNINKTITQNYLE